MVEGKEFYDEKYLIKGGHIYCDCSPILAKWYKDEYDFIGGNSKATALYTALLLRKRGNCIKEKFISKSNYKRYDEEKILELVEKYTGVDKKIILETEDWTNLSNYFMDNIIRLLKDIFSGDVLESKTVYLENVNSLKKLCFFINEIEEK